MVPGGHRDPTPTCQRMNTWQRMIHEFQKCIFYAFVTYFYKNTLHVILDIIGVTGLGPGGRRKGGGG